MALISINRRKWPHKVEHAFGKRANEPPSLHYSAAGERTRSPRCLKNRPWPGYSSFTTACRAMGHDYYMRGGFSPKTNADLRRVEDRCAINGQERLYVLQ
jgi:hypothetical protein